MEFCQHRSIDFIRLHLCPGDRADLNLVGDHDAPDIWLQQLHNYCRVRRCLQYDLIRSSKLRARKRNNFLSLKG